MAKFCNTCGARKEKGHECQLAKLSDGRTVRLERVTDPDGDIRQEIEKGEGLTVVARTDHGPLRTVSERLLEGVRTNG